MVNGISHLLPQAVLDSIAESQICLSNKDDKADSKGGFSLISCWNLIRIKRMPKTWSDVIWKAAVPPKISFFMWKLFHDAIPIDSKISQCGVQLASCCNCCTSSKCEDINHLLVDSELANYIWHSMSRIFVFSLFPNESIKARLMRICSRRYRSSLVGELTKVVPLIICWEIWKERCNRRYDNKASSSITILKRVVNDLQDCSFLSKPSKDATHAEEIVLSCLNIQPKCYQQRKKIIVKWLKPSFHQVEF